VNRESASPPTEKLALRQQQWLKKYEKTEKTMGDKRTPLPRKRGKTTRRIDTAKELSAVKLLHRDNKIENHKMLQREKKKKNKSLKQKE